MLIKYRRIAAAYLRRITAAQPSPADHHPRRPGNRRQTIAPPPWTPPTAPPAPAAALPPCLSGTQKGQHPPSAAQTIRPDHPPAAQQPPEDHRAARHTAGAALPRVFYNLALSPLPIPSLLLIPRLQNHLYLSQHKKQSVMLIPVRNRKPGQSSKTEPGDLSYSESVFLTLDYFTPCKG